MSPKFHSLTIKDVRKETKDAVSISFEIPNELIQDFQFSAGQYLTFKTLIDKEEVRRSYSLCSSPNENEWRVAIKEIENGNLYATLLNSGNKIIDENILITRNSVYAIHDVSKLREKRLNDLGIN